MPQKLQSSWSGSESGGRCELISSSSLKLGSESNEGEEVLVFWRSAAGWTSIVVTTSSRTVQHTASFVLFAFAVAGGCCMLLFGYSFAPSLPPKGTKAPLSNGSNKAQGESMMAGQNGAEQVT